MGDAKVPAPAKIAAQSVKPARELRPHTAATHAPRGTSKLLDLPVSDPSGPSAERAQAVRAFRGPSQPLPYRAWIEQSLGRDLSSVRAYESPAIARDLGANAVTVGSDVGFRTAPSLRLGAHEAAHVVQQRAELTLGTHADEVRANVIAARAGPGPKDVKPWFSK